MPPESPENLAIARVLLVALLQYLPLTRVVYGTEIEVTGKCARCKVPDLLVYSEESLAALAGATRATLTRDNLIHLFVGQMNSSRQLYTKG